MEIWIFNHYAVTPDLPGGTRHYDFSKELVRKGHNITIFASSFHYGLLKETKEYGKSYFIVKNHDGLNFVWLKTFPYSQNNWKRVLNMFTYSFRAYKVVKSNKFKKPHIIIGSSVHLFAVYVSYLLAKRYDIPFIMEVRDLWPQTLIDMGVPRLNPFVVLLSICEKFLYKNAKKIITLLPNAKLYINSRGVPLEKVVTIPNGVVLQRFKVKFSKNLREWENLSFKFTVTYTGAIGKANSLNVVLQAAEIIKKNYPQIRFLVVGDGPEKIKLLQASKKMNLNNIEFWKSVPKNKIVEILKKSDVLFFNLKESPVFKYGLSSNKLFDYLAAGKPIIFSCNSYNNPVSDANAGVTIQPESPQALSEAVIMLYNMSEEKRKKIGNNSKSYVEKNHSIPILANKLDKLIKSVINNHEFSN